MKSWERKLVKIVSTLILVCFFVVGLVIVLSYSLSPLLTKHRADFEKWASQILGAPVTMGGIHLSWYEYHPGLTFNQVTILSSDTHQPVLQIKHLKVYLSIIDSLKNKTFIPSGVMASGSHLDVYETKEGEIKLKGFPAIGGFQRKAFQTSTEMPDSLDWLASEPHIKLQDIDIRYTSKENQVKMVTLKNLTMENAMPHHVIIGEAILHQGFPTSVYLNINWMGERFDLLSIQARIYLYVSRASLRQWLSNYHWKNWQLNNGRFSAKIWANWDRGVFQTVQSYFQAYRINLYNEKSKKSFYINRLSGNVGWKRKNDEFVFAGNDILVDLVDRLWPVNNFYLSLKKNEQNQFEPKILNLGYLQIRDVQPFLLDLGLFSDPSSKQLIEKLNLNGSLENIFIRFPDDLDNWLAASFQASFKNIIIWPWENFPGFRNLSGQFSWNGNKGKIKLASKELRIYYNTVFEKMLSFHDASGEALIQHSNENWQIQISNLALAHRDLNLNLNSNLLLRPKASPFINVNALFSSLHANHFVKYLPIKLFNQDLANWLKQAFKSGEIDKGHLVLRGALNEFPFSNARGEFMLSSQLKEVDFSFAPDWPSIKKLNGNLVFSGPKMIAKIDDGNLDGINIGPIEGMIDDFYADKTFLYVNSHPISTSLEKALQVIKRSPLKETIGKMLSPLQLNGPMKLELGLNVPLADPSEVKVNGKIFLNNDEMNLKDWELKFYQMNGVLQFTESSVHANQITGRFFDKPFSLNLATNKDDPIKTVIMADLTSRLSISDLEKWSEIPVSKIMQGSSDVNSKIFFSQTGLARIVLNTDLKDVAIDLPKPLGKEKTEIRPLKAEFNLENDKPILANIDYADLGKIDLTLAMKSNRWQIKIDSEQFVGTIDVPKVFQKTDYINAQFSKLILHSFPEQNGSSWTVPFSNVPSINFSSDQLTINDIPFGIVTLETESNDQALQIKSLYINSPTMTLKANGKWTQKNGQNHSAFQGGISSTHVSKLLASFGLNVKNFIGHHAEARFDLNWDGLPFLPSFESLDGKASINFGEGRIIGVDDANEAKMGLGRMLSLFSLQTIPRRLSLNFSDLFQEGYAYDYIQGNFTFDDGDAFTENLIINGPVAKVNINGRIGLKNKDYNLILSVTPYVTSSIPIAATLLTGQPLIGLAALAVDKIVSSQVSRLTTYYYSITGPWDNPAWKSLDDKR